MSKFTLFTVFLSLTITVIVGELLVNQYGRYPQSQKQIAANLLADQEDSEGLKDSKETVVQSETPLSPNSQQTQLQNNGAQNSNPQTTNSSSQNITFTLLQNAGFSNMVLQRVPFNGILFNTIDLRDFKTVPVIQNNLLEDNRNQAAALYEFEAGSRMLATEIYALIKQKTANLAGVTLNETNQFGDNSFYINFNDNSQNVFLVVRLKDNVYALTYRKEYHPLIKELLNLLSP